MAGGWGCPHEVNDACTKINNLPCDPGMKGCVLAGRYVFASDDKNDRLRQKASRERAGSKEDPAGRPCPPDQLETPYVPTTTTGV